VYSSGNRIPVSPFQATITASASVASAAAEAPEYSAAAFAAVRAEVLRRRAELVPVAKRGPNTWVEWKGRPVPAPGVTADGQPVAASVPPAGTNTW
jgi:FtsP/CotA-like multicopper oxidase with cupredoxin domain